MYKECGLKYKILFYPDADFRGYNKNYRERN